MDIDGDDSEEIIIDKKRRKGNSNVWKHFKLSPNKKNAKCLSCKKMYKTSGNTTNLMDHLKRLHPLLTTPRKSHATLEDYFQKKSDSTYESNSSRKAELDKALAKMIATDIQPFRIVEDKGFREFVQCMDPRYKLPSRSTIRNVHLQKIFDDLEKKLQASLNNVDSCAITTDGWSSKANESYITVTCHYIDSEFKLRSVVLGTSKLANELNHSAENISQSLHVCLNKWNIFEKVNYVVTDNAPSMLKACELLGKKNLPCFAHSINLVVQDALSTEKVKVILTKCKHIVTYFKSSTIAYARLRKEQGDAIQYSLIQEVPTRWNSAFAMIQRILVVKDAIFAVLLSTPKAPQVFTADEVEQLEDLCVLLEPFNTITNIISGNQYVTISHIIPNVCGLYSTIFKSKSKLKTAVGLDTCTYLAERIQKRLFIYETRTASRLATILDPRFKKEAFRSAQNASQAFAVLENELVEVKRIVSASEGDIREPSTSKGIEVPEIYEFMKEKLSCKIKSNRADSIIALREYAEKPNEPLNSDALEYWKTRTSDMRHLQILAIRYLCIPATSCESERMFSKAGALISDRRCRLKEININMLLFINKNSWMIS